MSDLTNQIIAFENGELDEHEIIAFFTQLLNTGVINHLQGSYQRTAAQLIGAGLISA